MSSLKHKTSPVKVLKKKGSYDLHFRVRLSLQEERDSYRFEKSLGILCDPEHFDTVDQRIRRSHPSGRYAVNKLKAAMSKYGQLLEGIDQGMILTREDLHDFWERGTLYDDKLTLSEFIDHRINMKSREDVDYERKVKPLKRKWESCFPTPIMLHQITAKHIIKFMEHCHQTGAAGTSYLSELKKLMSKAQKERRIKYDDNPFNFAIDIPPVPTHLLRTKVEAPSMDEILNVYTYD